MRKRTFEQVGMRLGEIRSRLNRLRRERRADRCELVLRHGDDEEARWEETPCFLRAKEQADGHGIFPLCPACQRNGERAQAESKLRKLSGSALRALQTMYDTRHSKGGAT